jgi:hypothetical protein
MSEVKYSLTDLYALLKVGLRDSNLVNTDSPFHKLAKEVYSSVQDSGDPLSNKFYKNMKINVLQDHINIAKATHSKRSFNTEEHNNLVLVDDGFIQQTGEDYYPGKYKCKFMNPSSYANKFKLYQDYFKPTGRIGDYALMHSTGPVGMTFEKQTSAEITLKYEDRYKDKDVNCVIFIVDIAEGSRVELEELFDNKEGCKVYKIIYLVREHANLKLTRYHSTEGKDKGLNIIESQIVQFPDSSFNMEVHGEGSSYTQDLIYVDSYRDCITKIKGRFDCNKDSINNVVVNVHHKDVKSRSFIDVKSVLEDKSYSSFLGNIIVDNDATDVKAHLTNKNLLLSDKASAVSEPQLDINTKEIECTHGCTISNINEEDLYYLNSKGIENSTAKTLLKEAFLK